MNRPELENNIQDLLDGILTGDKLKATQHELRHSTEAKDIYRDFVHIKNGLELQAESDAANVIPINRIIKRQRLRSMRTALVSAAALVAISFVGMHFFSAPAASPARVAVSPSMGARYAITSADSQESDSLASLEQGAQLDLYQGSISLAFENGVDSIVQAPASLSLTDANSLFLEKGQAWFNVPAQAVGFQVTTDNLDVVDLGTEFGVVATSSGEDEIHVFKGAVEAASLSAPEAISMVAIGEALKVGQDTALERITPDPAAFQTTLPESLAYMHWSFDEITDGGFAAKGSATDHDIAKPSQASASELQTNGRFGKAVKFTGTEGQELLTGYLGPKPELAHTVACWIKLPAPGNAYSAITSWSFPDSSNRFGRWIFSPHGLHLGVYGSGEQVGFADLSPDTWHHVAYVYHGTSDENLLPDVDLYIDGGKVPFESQRPDTVYRYTGKSSHIAHPFTIGGGLLTTAPNRPVFNGSIDELYCIEGALSADQVNALYSENTYQQ